MSASDLLLSLIILPPPPPSPLFPYTTLFRSQLPPGPRHRPPHRPDRAQPPRRHERQPRCRHRPPHRQLPGREAEGSRRGDRKSTRLNSSHLVISYAVFCLKKKTKII